MDGETADLSQDAESNNSMPHSLIEQLLEDGSVHNYYCVQCDAEYSNIEAFIESHGDTDDSILEENIEICTEERQWEVLDDIIGCDDPAVDSNASKQNDVVDEKTGTEYILGIGGDLIMQNVEGGGGGEDFSLTIKEEDDDIGDNKYYCYDCRTLFRDLQDAEDHDCPGINNKLEEDEAVNDCDKDAVGEIEAEGNTFMCAYCEEKFFYPAELQQHHISCPNLQSEEFLAEQKPIFQCPICSKMFESIKSLSSHSRMHKTKLKKSIDVDQSQTVPESSTCHVCNTHFANIRSLKLHLRIHRDRPIRRIQEALPKVAAQKYNRLNHFFCEICNKSFEENLMDVHKNMHQNIEEFICQVCNRQFKNKESYEMHQQLHSASENDSKKNFIINTGPTEAALRNAKNGVKSTHVANAKKTFPCQYCGHLFWRPHEKVRHEYVHTGEKPYPCEVCGKRFRVPYSLTLHLRTHTNIRPYVCSNCNKRFKSHSVYSHHMRTHLNDRDYACDICGKTFRTTVQLYGHRNIHTKPFNCTVCSRPFASLFAVNAHMKSHEKGKDLENLKHVCNICGAVYGAVRALRAHKKEKHNAEPNETTSPPQTSFDISDYAEGGSQSADDEAHFEADEAAMLLINAAAEASVNHESLENLSVDQYYLNAGMVSGLENI